MMNEYIKIKINHKFVEIFLKNQCIVKAKSYEKER